MPELSAPAIIFNVKAHQYYPPDTSFPQGSKDAKRMEESLFFRCSNSQYNIISYLTRKGANEASDMKTLKVMQKMVEMTSSSTKDILDYAKNRPGSTGLWNREGDISDKKLKTIRKELRNTKSTVWSAVVSFTPEYAMNFCSSRADAYNLISSTIDKFFKDANLEPENMNWHGAYHINTDQPHIHLIFWEKAPIKYSQRAKEPQYSSWKIKPDALLDYKLTIAKHFNTNKLDYFSLRDDIRNAMKISLKSEQWLYKLSELEKSLTFGHKNQYKRVLYIDRKKIDSFVNEFINEDAESKNVYNTYIAKLYETQKQLRALFEKEEDKQVPARVNEFASSRIEELYSRLGNEVLNTLKLLPKQATSDTELDPTPETAYELSAYNNVTQKANLGVRDSRILKLIALTKEGKIFNSLFDSEWTNTQSDTSGEFKGYYYQTYRLCRMIARQTQNPDTIERIYKASGLYRPDIWNAQYTSQLRHVAAIERINTVGATVRDVVLNAAIMDAQIKPPKTWGQWNFKIRQSAISYKKFVNSFMSVIARMGTDRQATLNQWSNEIARLDKLRRQRGEEIYEEAKEQVQE